MTPQMSDEFTAALRTLLVQRTEEEGARRTKLRWRWLAAGALGLLLTSGTTVAVANWLVLPGGTAITPVASRHEAKGTGPKTISLGAPPESATAVSFDLTCLSAGTFELGKSGASMTCTEADAGTRSGRSSGTLPLSSLEGETFTLGADENASWELSIEYVNEISTDWATNDKNETFGVENENGSPDLVAVIATNGRQGYVKRVDFEEADGTAATREFTSPEDALKWQEQRRGKSFSIPVYEFDGSTVIGEFVVRG